MRVRDFFRYGEWVILKKGTRFLGLRQNHYDGPIMEFGLWWWTFFSLGYDYRAWKLAFDAGSKSRDSQIYQLKSVLAGLVIQIELDEVADADLIEQAKKIV